MDCALDRLPITRQKYSTVAVAIGLLALAYVLATLPLALAGMLVAGGTLVLLVLVRPVWGLYLLPFLVPFGSIRAVALGPARVGGTEALLGLVIAAWIARGIARRELRLHRPPLLIPLVLFLGVLLASVLGALSLSASLKELIKWGEVAALYIIAWHEIDRRDALVIVLAMLTAGALAALHGIYQSVFHVGPDGFLFPLAGRLWLRAYGLFEQPNPYAGYLGLTIPLAYGLLIAGLGTPLRTRDAEELSLPTAGAILLYAAGTGAIMLAALVLTLSRGAWIGAAAAVFVVSVVLSRRAAVASATAGVAAALFFALGGLEVLPAALRQRATDFLPYVGQLDVRGVEITDQNFAVIERLAHWQAAVGMFADRPWFGFGIGNYAPVYPAYNVPPWDDPLGHAHNIYLNFAAETGIVGLAAYLLFWAAALWLTWRAIRGTTGLWRGLAIGCLGVFVHLATHNFFDNLYVHGMYLHIALLLAIIARLATEGTKGTEGATRN